MRGSATPRIDGYSNLREIGSGGFSRVYEAHQHEFDRRVAIKVLNRRLVDDVSVGAFERECQSMGVISKHPYIVTVLASAFTSDHRPCIVMDLFHHGSYMSILRREGAISLDELLPVSVRMAGALATAHRHGVIHGDVKPQNIFKSEFGYPALGDFGISTLTDRRSDDSHVGLSPHYAAPELIESGGSDAAPVLDLYSLAASIFTLAVGRRPFESVAKESPQQVLLRVLTAPTPSLPSTFPRALSITLRKAMARDPEDRYPDLATFGTALTEVERQIGYQPTAVPLAATETETPDTESKTLDLDPRSPVDHQTVTIAAIQQPSQPVIDIEPEPQKSHRRTWIAALALLLAVSIVGTVSFLLQGSNDNSETLAPLVNTVPEDDFFVFVSDVTGLVGTLEDRSATFTWDATDSEDVVYRVLREDVTTGAPRTVDTAGISFDRLAAGERPCIRVLVLHEPSGAMSTPGVTGCAEDAKGK